MFLLSDYLSQWMVIFNQDSAYRSQTPSFLTAWSDEE